MARKSAGGGARAGSAKVRRVGHRWPYGERRQTRKRTGGRSDRMGDRGMPHAIARTRRHRLRINRDDACHPDGLRHTVSTGRMRVSSSYSTLAKYRPAAL